jgi:protein ImuB
MEGPERITPEWWRKGKGAARDYYRIEDRAGRRYWLFREEARWFLHGLFP